MDHRLEAGRTPRAALGNAHQFGTVHNHLARSGTGKAHVRRPPGVGQTAVVDCGRWLELGERIAPQLPNPPHRSTDIVSPPFVGRGNLEVEPYELAGPQQDPPTTRPPTNDIDATLRRRHDVNGIGALRRTKHQRRRLNGEERHDPVIAREFSRMKRTGVAGDVTDVPRGHRQLASARYRFQASGTRLTDTVIQASSFGARGGRASRMPASSGVRSRLRRLHGRQAAATFSQMC